MMQVVLLPGSVKLSVPSDSEGQKCLWKVKHGNTLPFRVTERWLLGPGMTSQQVLPLL